MERTHLLIRGAFLSFWRFVDRVLALSLQQKHTDNITIISIISRTAPIPATTKPVMFCSLRDIPKQDEDEDEV